jgi:hypothetical protein
VLRVESAAADFRGLFEAAGAAGVRIGWLELSAPGPLPAGLAAAAGAGALRAVGVGSGTSAAVKALHGEAVLADLLREHFRGCAAVLVAGQVDAPLLEPGPDGWRMTPAGEAARRYDSASLLAALRAPRL